MMGTFVRIIAYRAKIDRQTHTAHTRTEFNCQGTCIDIGHTRLGSEHGCEQVSKVAAFDWPGTEEDEIHICTGCVGA